MEEPLGLTRREDRPEKRCDKDERPRGKERSTTDEKSNERAMHFLDSLEWKEAEKAECILALSEGYEDRHCSAIT